MHYEISGEVGPEKIPEIPQLYLELMADAVNLANIMAVEDKADQSEQELKLSPDDVQRKLHIPIR